MPMIVLTHPINIMKTTYITSIFAAVLLFAGCASKETASSEPAQAAPTGESVQVKTAYEGSTGSGLLMERYKSGNIEGYRD